MSIKKLIVYTVIFSIILTSTLVFPVHAKTGLQFSGAVEKAAISPDPSNPGAEFGNAVAISGDTMIVGARYDSVPLDKELQYYSGAAYVYVKDGNNWVQQTRLAASTPQAGDLFGSSVAIDRDTIVVGAVGNDSIDENGNAAPGMGAVYIFARSGDQWQQQAKIEPEDGSKADYFGNAVAIVGERIIVGASGKDIGNTTDTGKVYSYYRSGTKWYQSQSISASNPEKNAGFGSSLDLDGPRLVVGAPSENKIGAAYIFYRIGSTWVQESKIEPNDSHSGDSFGASVSIDDETVVVGVPFADPDLGAGQVINAGAAYVFKKRANTWKQAEKIMVEDARAFDNFGDSVLINGKTIVVGATGQNYYNTLRVGSAYAFERNEGNWELKSRLISTDPYNENNFGSSIAIDGELIFIGEPGTSPRAGTIHIYSIESGILPETGFAPGKATSSPQVKSPESPNAGWLDLEIPKIGLNSQVVGIPYQGNTWNVQWLSNDVGHLEGTAYPTHFGNSVIAGHLNLPDGTDGPFADIHQLAWGDQIIIHLDGHDYVYEVREIFQTNPNDLDILVKDGNYDWLTLITCKDYDPATQSFGLRTVVVAVRTE